MSLIGATSIAFQYPSTENLFENLTFSINQGDRIAIAGPNGCGKTTLLSLLEGALEPTAGGIVRRTGLVFAKAAQQVPSDADTSLVEFVHGARPALDAMRRLVQTLEHTDPIDYASALHDYMEAGGFAAEAETEKILTGLGFSAAELPLSLRVLSGGQRRRAALARALHTEADILLLDEPTNHLDMAGREWLSAELATRRQACIVISHDRALLRSFANRIIDIGRRTSTVFEGGYDAWRAASDLLDRQAWADYEAAQRRKAAAEQAAAKRAQLATKVATPPPGARHGHDFYRRKAAKVDRTARILRERSFTEAKVAKPYEEQPIPGLSFDNVARIGGFPLRAEGLAKSYGGRLLFSDLDLQLPPGARLAIAGPNGCGKTTLLRVLAGLETPDRGRVLRSAATRPACLLQDASNLEPALTPLELCGRSTIARTLMGCLKLRPDCANRPIAELSPGERVKVALARLLSGGANLLLLDEPTEHLEIEAQEALEKALAAYPGALVIISHDRAFLDALGPKLLVIDLAVSHRNETPIRNV